jgi:restriction system protein
MRSHRTELLSTLRALPPAGFERLCQCLLQRMGFNEVQVTGQTGDCGIDGHGTLEMNHIVNVPMCFQCKRYSGSVGSPAVRDFRGAMSGRAGLGIIFTTGTFTSEARKEAVRDGVHRIELIDSERLLDKLEEFMLGLLSVTVVDEDFFRKLGELSASDGVSV